MEKEIRFLEELEFPASMNFIFKNLKKLEISQNDFNELMDKCKRKNYEFLKSLLSQHVKNCAMKISKELGKGKLSIFSISELPDEAASHCEDQMAKIFGDYPFDRQKLMEIIEEKFYSALVKFLSLCFEEFKRNAEEISEKSLKESRDLFKSSLSPDSTLSEILFFHVELERPFKHIEKLNRALYRKIDKKAIRLYYEEIEIFIYEKLKSLIACFEETNRDLKYLNISCNILDQFSSNKSCIGLNIPAFFYSEIEEYQWSTLSIYSKLNVYFYLYLISSDDLAYLKEISNKSPLNNPRKLNKYSPESRETLRLISQSYPIPALDSFTIIKLIETCSSSYLPSINKEDLSSSIASIIAPKRIPSFEQFSIVQNIDPPVLKNLSSRSSSHITICVSGYLSETDDHIESWESLTELYPFNSFFSYCWSSSSKWKLLKAVTQRILPQDHFNEHYEKAVSYGVYLAELITSLELFNNTCISLVGFSLGTVVVYSCLQVLSSAKQVFVHDCILLGSAIDRLNISTNKIIKENVISGKFVNVYSKKDQVLSIFFNRVSPFGAFGSKSVQDIDSIDVTEAVGGHLNYRSNLGKIFKLVKDF